MRVMRGFTLIEAMIVVAVIAILTAIAIPSYQNQVRTSRRGQAKADMMEIVQALERYNTVNDRFTGYTPTATTSPKSGDPLAYNVVVSNLARTTFTVTATPQGNQTADGCGTLTVNHAGARTDSGDNTDCW